MLDPYFFRRPVGGGGNPIKLNKGCKFSVTGYAVQGKFTLVSWEITNGEESVHGQTLYSGKRQVEATGGVFDFVGEDDGGGSFTPDRKRTVWDRVNSKIGKNGIPVLAASKIQKNSRFFKI